jgi:SAM-dependent methyltransferase
MIQVSHPVYRGPVNEQANHLLAAKSSYPASDLPLFTAGYNELARVDLNGTRVLEICCGGGGLAVRLGTAFPQAEVVAVDRYSDAAAEIKAAGSRLPGVRYEQGNALHLPQFADASFDLIYGQASLHHLAHDIPAVAREYSRLLKPHGRLVFIFEPLGNNPLVAAIRGARFALVAAPDESNLFFHQVEEIAQSFSKGEIQCFNLLGYPLKSLNGDIATTIAKAIDKIDHALFARGERWQRWAANCNLVFTK